VSAVSGLLLGVALATWLIAGAWPAVAILAGAVAIFAVSVWRASQR